MAFRLVSMTVNFRGFLFFALAAAAHGEGDVTALGAVRLLPKEAARRLARIEAREAVPAPERWYLLVHDPAAPQGMREFVVAGGKLVASRTLSQFADSMEAADVIGADAVKFDSDKVARIASFFAMANGGRLGSLTFELLRIPEQGGPVWRATVLDPQGDQLGVLVVTAAKGAIVSHDGFEKLPPAGLLNVPMAGAEPAPAIASGSPGSKGRPTKVAPIPKAIPMAPTPTPTPTPRVGLLNRIFRGKPKPAEPVPP